MKITHIVNATDCIQNMFEQVEAGSESGTDKIQTEYLQISVSDLPSVQISDYFP